MGQGREFRKFRERLLREGIAPAHVIRISTELREHRLDIFREARASGCKSRDAHREAKSRLGDLTQIADVLAARADLKTWTYRYPWLARYALPAIWVCASPALPLIACINNSSSLARWGTATMLGGVISLGLFATLQLILTGS